MRRITKRALYKVVLERAIRLHVYQVLRFFQSRRTTGNDLLEIGGILPRKEIRLTGPKLSRVTKKVIRDDQRHRPRDTAIFKDAIHNSKSERTAIPIMCDTKAERGKAKNYPNAVDTATRSVSGTQH